MNDITFIEQYLRKQHINKSKCYRWKLNTGEYLNFNGRNAWRSKSAATSVLYEGMWYPLLDFKRFSINPNISHGVSDDEKKCVAKELVERGIIIMVEE